MFHDVPISRALALSRFVMSGTTATQDSSNQGDMQL